MGSWFYQCCFIVAIGLISGCSHPYIMSTHDGRLIKTQNKPSIDKETGLLSYKDEMGRRNQINQDQISSMIKK